MRILHLIASHRWTGAAEPAARLAAAEQRLGHAVLFALTTGSSLDQHARALGVEVTGEVPFGRGYLPHKKLNDLLCLRRLVSRFKPDIVHAHLTHDHILSAFALGTPRPGVPRLVRTFHREESPRTDLFTTKFLFPRTAGAFVVSDSLGDLVRGASGWPVERLCRLGGAVDVDRFKPSADGMRMREKWGIPADAQVVGLVSRLRAERGVPWVLDAAGSFLAGHPERRLVICGRGKYRAEMLRRIEAHPCGGQIVAAGYVDGADLEAAYNAFDVALMLRPGNDGACRSALEAMACGRPIVGGDTGAIRDLLRGGEGGWLVPDGDEKALAGAISRGLSDPTACRAKGTAAREFILARHSEGELGRRSVEFYQHLLDPAPRPRA